MKDPSRSLLVVALPAAVALWRYRWRVRRRLLVALAMGRPVVLNSHFESGSGLVIRDTDYAVIERTMFTGFGAS